MIKNCTAFQRARARETSPTPLAVACRAQRVEPRLVAHGPKLPSENPTWRDAKQRGWLEMDIVLGNWAAASRRSRRRRLRRRPPSRQEAELLPVARRWNQQER